MLSGMLAIAGCSRTSDGLSPDEWREAIELFTPGEWKMEVLEHEHRIDGTLGNIVPAIIVVHPYWVEIKVQGPEGYVEGDRSQFPTGGCGTSFTNLEEGLHIVSAESRQEESTKVIEVELIELTTDSLVSLAVHQVKD